MKKTLILALCLLLQGCSNAFCWSPNPKYGTGEPVPPELYEQGYRGWKVPGCLAGAIVKYAIQEPGSVVNAVSGNPVANTIALGDLIKKANESEQ